MLNHLLSERPRTIAVAKGPSAYVATIPFSPAERFPEYTGKDAGQAPNEVYSCVREAFRLLGLDAERFGTPQWNPLGEVIKPGDTVVLKPNFVRNFRESSPDDADCLITHGSVIRAILDYALIAMERKGRLVVCDAPQNDADFEGVKRIVQLDALQAYYRDVVGFPLETYDLRPECAHKIDGVIVSHRALPGDPAGYTKVNLGAHSMFDEVGEKCRQLYGAEYDRSEVVRHHSAGVHEYLVSRTLLEADCVISVPKLKTHKKTGLTANLKNLVGINGNKNWLPHHREGTPRQGGDQFADDRLLHRAERGLVAVFKKVFPLLGPLRQRVAGPIKGLGKGVFGDTNKGTVRSGNWYGNDTTWRMVIDLNRILFYADAEGRLHDQPVRRFLSVVDGIVGGEGNGPLDPKPHPAGVIFAGYNPLAVDLACARLMGFDHRRIPAVFRALQPHALPLASFGYEDLRVSSNEKTFQGPLTGLVGPLLAFEPHFGWRGHIEVPDEALEAGAIA